MNRFRTYSIWSEGYRATGQSSGATFLGQAQGMSFKDACKNLMKRIDPSNEYYNPNTNTYWACSLFDNATDARRTYG